MGFITGLLKGVAGSLVGNALDQRKENRQWDRQALYENPRSVRKRFEQAGFNPLLAYTGNGAGTQAPTIGARSSAASIVSNAISDETDKDIAKAQIEQENERLRELADTMLTKEPSRRIYTDGTSPRPSSSSENVSIAQQIRNDQKNDQRNDPDVEKRKSPLTFGDDDAHTENILGVDMPFDSGDRNTAAGGDVLGEFQTMKEYTERLRMKHEREKAEKAGHYTFMSNGKLYVMKRPTMKGKPEVDRTNPGWFMR